jgi:hypothetical protein
VDESSSSAPSRRQRRSSSFRSRIQRPRPVLHQQAARSNPTNEIDSIQRAYRAPLPTHLPLLENPSLERAVYRREGAALAIRSESLDELSYRTAYSNQRLRWLGLGYVLRLLPHRHIKSTFRIDLAQCRIAAQISREVCFVIAPLPPKGTGLPQLEETLASLTSDSFVAALARHSMLSDRPLPLATPSINGTLISVLYNL